ncbi:MAG: DeoR family transcriptional regulator [Methanothrix sp.]|nr:DeoR family transcriptional regulator [Methanothrix sp.]
MNSVNEEEKQALKKPIIDACIKSARKNGRSDAMGIIRGALFLENEPLSLDTLAERTGYSKTTVRSNMSHLENVGLARRVVGPVGKTRRDKQHRYSLETDTGAMRQAIQSKAKAEVHSVLQALIQVEKNLESHKDAAEEMSAIILKTRQFYEETDRILRLMDRYTHKELIEILERNCR